MQRAKLLVGQLDLNGLIGTFKLDSGESGACPRLNGFLHKKQSIHKSINGGTCPTALLRLSFEIECREGPVLLIKMHHHCNAFSQASVQEFLFYFKRSLRTFSFWIIGEESELRIDGKQSYPRKKFISLTAQVANTAFGLDLDIDKEAHWTRKVGGTSPLIGSIVSGSEIIGTCWAENDQKGGPVIRVETCDPRSRLEAHKTDPGLVMCPLLVSGLENCEVVLENYYSLARARRQELPQTKLKRHFVGSCRTKRYREDPLGDDLLPLTILVSVSQFIVQEHYMALD